MAEIACSVPLLEVDGVGKEHVLRDYERDRVRWSRSIAQHSECRVESCTCTSSISFCAECCCTCEVRLGIRHGCGSTCTCTCSRSRILVRAAGARAVEAKALLELSAARGDVLCEVDVADAELGAGCDGLQCVEVHGATDKDGADIRCARVVEHRGSGVQPDTDGAQVRVGDVERVRLEHAKELHCRACPPLTMRLQRLGAHKVAQEQRHCHVPLWRQLCIFTATTGDVGVSSEGVHEVCRGRIARGKAQNARREQH